MDNSSENFSNMGRPSPRREFQLQGPRPTPLRVHKDSHKIKKPPVARHGEGPSRTQQQQQQQAPAPVIIYTLPPKVVHTDPSNFMKVVQRLTGASPTTLAASAAAAAAAADEGGSSAASRPGSPSLNPLGHHPPALGLAIMGCPRTSSDHMGIGGEAALDRPGHFPGILSPLPSAPPPVSPIFFLPPAVDPATSLAFLNDMSPAVQDGDGGFAEGTFLRSSGDVPSTPNLPSPGAYWDLFNQL